MNCFLVEKNVSIEMASYLTTLFDPSFGMRLVQSNDSIDFPPSYLETNLQLILYNQAVTLPELLRSVSIKLVN